VIHKKVKVTRSSGNVFRDLGFSPGDAEYLKVRSDLMLNLQKAIAGRGLKQAEAAKLLGVTQPRISDLMRGRIDLFSIDTLINMLARLGIRTKVVLQPYRRRAGAA
jgi:predicted XRE-type DNA-binding protein